MVKHDSPTTKSRWEAKTGLVQLLPIGSIFPTPQNDTLYGPINPADPTIQALAMSIRVYGVKEPLVLTRDFYILSGHRRYAAGRLAGLQELPCRVSSKAELDITKQHKRWERTLATQSIFSFVTLPTKGCPCKRKLKIRYPRFSPFPARFAFSGGVAARGTAVAGMGASTGHTTSCSGVREAPCANATFDAVTRNGCRRRVNPTVNNRHNNEETETPANNSCILCGSGCVNWRVRHE